MSILRGNRLKKEIIFLVLLLISVSCVRKDPSERYNKEFISKHGGDVAKAKKRHKKISKRNKMVSLQDSKLKQADFDKKKTEEVKVDEYANYKTSIFGDYYSDNPDYQDEYKETELSYMKRNLSVYETKGINFDDIRIPRRDIFADSNLGDKDFEFINNKNMQESFDYMYVIQKEREKNMKILQAKQEKLEKDKEVAGTENIKEKSALTKAKDTVTEFKNRVLNLLN